VATNRVNQPAVEELAKLGITPSKLRGQNFLTDRNAVREILDFAELRHFETVVEVGPGLGALTYELALRTSDLYLVEIEEGFSKDLREKLEVKVIQKDIRDVFLKEHFNKKVIVVSNVPYSISTDFSLWLFREHELISSASLLLQKEFAQRLGAGPGSRAYGSLSVLRALYATATLGPIVPPTAFYPAPKVESQLIRLEFGSPEISIDSALQPEFEKFVRACFSQKRKTLSNALSSSALFESKDETKEFLSQAHLPTTARAEELEPKKLLEIFQLYLKRSA